MILGFSRLQMPDPQATDRLLCIFTLVSHAPMARSPQQFTVKDSLWENLSSQLPGNEPSSTSVLKLLTLFN